MTTATPYWQQLPREEALVLACARTNLAGAVLSRAESLIPGIKWDRFKILIHEHGIGSLIYPNLKRHFATVVPGELLTQLKQHSIATAQSNLGLLRELIATIQQLKSHNIECAVFKGLIINQLIYRDLSIRKSGDIDLLVREKDYPRAKAFFLSQTFSQTLTDKVELLCLQSGLWHEERRLQIDLHWGIPPRELEINADKVMDKISDTSISEINIPTFSQEDMFIVLCVNAIKEHWNQLLYPYCDLYEFLQGDTQPDWGSLYKRARELNCQRAVAVALSIVKTLYDVTLPLQAEEKFKLTSSGELIKQELLRQLFEKDTSGSKIINKSGHHLYYFDSTTDYFSALIDGSLQRIEYRYFKSEEPDRIRKNRSRGVSILHHLASHGRTIVRYVLQTLRRWIRQ